MPIIKTVINNQNNFNAEINAFKMRYEENQNNSKKILLSCTPKYCGNVVCESQEWAMRAKEALENIVAIREGDIEIRQSPRTGLWRVKVNYYSVHRGAPLI